MADQAPAVRLLGPAEIRALADRLGVRPSKRLGQNFVVEPGTVRKIASLAALEPSDVVLEVGPGLGSLTLALLEAGPASWWPSRSTGRWPASCRGRSPAARRRLADRVAVVTADALQVAAHDLPAVFGSPSVLVANLPYNVAVPVLLHLLAAAAHAAAGPGHGPGRGGGPDVRRTRVTGVRRARR